VVIERHLSELEAMGAEKRLEARYEKFRGMGVFEERLV
jgi:acetyl-CoA carboxylase alpha subunit